MKHSCCGTKKRKVEFPTKDEKEMAILKFSKNKLKYNDWFISSWTCVSIKPRSCLDLFWVSITGYYSLIRRGFFLLKPVSVKEAVHNVLV